MISLRTLLSLDASTPMRLRLFRLFCVTTALMSVFIVIPLNLVQNLPWLIQVGVAFLAMFALFCFWASLKHQRHYTAAFFVALIVVLTPVWFLNAGSQGSIAFYFLPVVLYPITLYRGWLRWALTGMLAVDLCGMLLLEHAYPALVTPFNTPGDRLIDLCAGMICSCLLLATIAALILAAYDREQQRLSESSRELDTSAQNYRAIFNAANDAIFVQDACDGTVLDVNDRMLEMYGYTHREEVIGLENISILSAEGPASYTEAQRRLQLAVKEGPQIFDWHARRKDGSHFWAEVSLRSALINGVPRILAVVRDTTERRTLEDHLRQSQKMEAVGQLAGGVAHDFNNILTSSLMQVSLMLNDPETPPQMRAGLETLRDLSVRSARLTRQLLTFSRRQPVTMEALDINQVLADLFSMLEHLLEEHVKIRQTLHETPLYIKADLSMIEQVVTNLAVNARDAMEPHGGELCIEVRPVECTRKDAQGQETGQLGSFVCLQVKDTGCGMAPETLKRIFEPFYTTKEVGKGTGLGLPTVFGITQLHEGWIEVESELGKGSCFRVFFPLLQAPPESKKPAVNPPLLRADETILLVEDDEIVRESTIAALRFCGYQLLTAANGREALEVWVQHREEISLLFTDAVMPEGISGIDLACELRRERPQLKVIITSGYSRELLEAGEEKLPGAVYLTKPYEMNELNEALRAVLDQP